MVTFGLSHLDHTASTAITNCVLVSMPTELPSQCTVLPSPRTAIIPLTGKVLSMYVHRDGGETEAVPSNRKSGA